VRSVAPAAPADRRSPALVSSQPDYCHAVPHRPSPRPAALWPPRRTAVALLAVLTIFAIAGCAPSNDRSRLTVAIAASLEPAFTVIVREFEDAHPGIDVTLEPGSSTALAARIADGAPYSVLAGADASRVASLGADLAGPVTVFATNRLAIAVPPGNPRRVRGLADLARLRITALCDIAAPCGRYADEALTAAEVTLPESRITRAPDATTTLRAVTRGDAEAAVVYVTDVRSAGPAAEAVTIPPSANRTARYGIAVLAGADDPGLAREFVTTVTDPRGRAALTAAGFGVPGP